MSASVVVRLPLPPRSLAPHNKGHWRTRAADVKQCRSTARLAALHVARVMAKARLHIEYDVTVGKGDGGYRPFDEGNAISACKPYIDGCVDAGIVPDDKAKYLKIAGVDLVRRGMPGVTLTFVEVAG